MSEPVSLSRQFLSDAGGWREMKAARALHAAGRVEEAGYEGGVLAGKVREGSRTLSVRAVVRGPTDVENHCSCVRARREGIVCCHVLALGLEVLEPGAGSGRSEAAVSKATGVPTPSRSDGAPAPASTEALSPDWPALSEPGAPAVPGEPAPDPASLHLVVPPNLRSAWAKGRVTLGVEVEAGGDRRLLSSLPARTKLLLDEADRALFLALQRLSPESVPGMVSLPTKDLASIWDAAVGHPRVTLGRGRPLKISARPLRPSLRHLGGLRFEMLWPEASVPLPSVDSLWALSRGERLHPVAPGLEPRWLAAAQEGTRFPPEEFAAAFGELARHFEIEDLPLRRPPLEVRLELEGSLNHLEAKLFFRYGEREESAAKERLPLLEVKEAGFVGLELPDPRGEAEAVAALEDLGFVRRGGEGLWILKDKDAILHFLAHGYPRFAARYRLETGERFEHALAQVEPVEAKVSFQGSGTDWFAMELAYETAGGDSLSREEVERLLGSGRRSRPLSSGRIAVIDAGAVGQLGEWLRDTDPRQERPGLFRVGRLHADYLGETAKDLGLRLVGVPPWQDEGEGLEFYDLSPEFDSLLRPYQREGLAWMRGLASRGMGGILADDMGLGKTLQALALIYSVGGTSLVVCPSSLVFNWVEEAAKFVPDLKAVAVEGADRAAVLAEHGDADLFVTSYALLRRDEAVWAEREFDVVVLDEAQHIKNPEAQVSRIAHRLRGTHRFALTGTPIENSVRDLWSIAAFALPGYLGSQRDFAERFEKPLASAEAPPAVRERLARRLRPVVLRRLKREVAADLPERIEQTVFCELGPHQRAVYDRLLREGRGAALQADGGRRRIVALTALLRLRQACCDLRLLGLDPPAEPNPASEGNATDGSALSGKFAAFLELVEEAVAGGHRVLVFSQFVGMLQLLVPELLERGLRYCYLDGSTRDRGEVVRRFQAGEVPLFLISLKAGGTGLNLTAADTVIHLDPWWNPAVEAQATDRAHRIGQERVVTSYKLIARGTVEEKILALQQRKRAVADDLLETGDGAVFDEGELMGLFEV